MLMGHVRSASAYELLNYLCILKEQIRHLSMSDLLLYCA